MGLSDDEFKIRQKLHAKKSETTLQALERFMKDHKKTVDALHKARVTLRKGKTWHGLRTINSIANSLGITRNTVKEDVRRELLHPAGKRNVNGRFVLVFSKYEVRNYKEYREAMATVPGEGKFKTLERMLRERNGNVDDVAKLLKIEPKSVEKMLQRHGKSAEDYLPQPRLYRVEVA